MPKDFKEAIKIGTKNLLADQDFLLKTVREFIAQELSNVEGRIDDLFLRDPTAREFFDHLFKDSK